MIVNELVLELVNLLLLDLGVVGQAVVGLVIVRHLLLQLLSGSGHLLNLLLKFRVDILCILHLLSEVDLVLVHGLRHLLDLVQPVHKLVLQMFSLATSLSKLGFTLVELTDKRFVCLLRLSKLFLQRVVRELLLLDLVKDCGDVTLHLLKLFLQHCLVLLEEL